MSPIQGYNSSGNRGGVSVLLGGWGFTYVGVCLGIGIQDWTRNL